MTATVVRIAQFIGLHRDGSTFGLPPFEVEMRSKSFPLAISFAKQRETTISGFADLAL